MQSTVKSVAEYLKQVPEERVVYFNQLRDAVRLNLPEGFVEEISYGMIGYVVPHKLYPAGYHCDPSLPLPFASIASQKNFIALYHMGLYANGELLDWFVKEYTGQSKQKLDMGKSCIRFKKADQIPYTLIGELMQKVTVKDWIALYEKAIKSKSK
jgi:uncharacterized protein YdhG (YjbR/CyaY superfamily)